MDLIKKIFHLLKANFLGQSPAWYKITIVAFLILNPLLYYFVDPFVAGWVVLVEFIFTLACALKCYPLQPGGLLAIEAIAIGLTNPHTVYDEVLGNAPTLLLLIFMVSAIYFIKDVLFIVMTKLFLTFRKKYVLSLVFCLICASLSAFLDALTLVAIAIAVCFNFYAIYYRVESHSGNKKEMDEFCGFLRNLIIHGTVGTIIGGTMTIVGEPNNMMIGTKMGWSFMGFIAHCAPISVPAALAGFTVCFSLEFFKCPGFHYQMPERARELIFKDYNKKMHEMTEHNVYVYSVQIIVFILLVLALACHVAEVGLIGIGLIVIVTAFTGLTKEHDLGVAFTNAMPFAVLIIVFFAILGVAHEQHLITPLANWVFTFSGKAQLIALYFTNGTLSFVSDNVFVATVFINEVENAYKGGIVSDGDYEKLAVVVNMGTNIPAMATPNGHAALLFLLTSSLAPVLKLSYFQMFKLTLPYTIAMTLTGALAIYFFL
jgi:NhaB family Na+:H+ antiporter